MATYTVTSPSGQSYRVNTPAQFVQPEEHGPWENYKPSGTPKPQGPTREQASRAFYAAMAAGNEDDAKKLIGYIQQRGMTLAPMNAQEENSGFQKQNAANVAAQSPLETFMQGAGKSVVDTGRGLAELVGLESPPDIAHAQQMDQALSNSTAGKIGDFAGQAAQMYLTGGALGAGAKALGFAGRALPYATAALTSGAFSGAQPVQAGQSRLLNTAVGAGLGAAGEALSPALGAVGRKLAPAYSDAKQAALDTAQRYGIPLHLTQVANSPFGKVVGSVTKYLPFSGSYAADQAQRQAWNRALASTIGQKATELSPDVMAAARTANSNAYNALFARNAVKVDDNAINRLAAIQQQAHADLTPEQAGIVDRQIDKYLNAAGDNGGTIAGRRYQNIRQELLGVEGHAQPSSHYVKHVRNAMEDAAEQSMGPQDASELRGLNAQYKNLKTLDKGLTQNGGANYTISPANLWRLTQGKFGGTPELRALGQLGQTVLKDPIHDSGTAQRLLAYRLLGVGTDAGVLGAGVGGYLGMVPHVLPVAAGLGATGATVGRFMNSPLAARVVPNLLPGTFNMLSRVPSRYLLPLAATSPGTR